MNSVKPKKVFLGVEKQDMVWPKIQNISIGKTEY